jgi:hypothetical protein
MATGQCVAVIVFLLMKIFFLLPGKGRSQKKPFQTLDVT